MDAAFRKLQAEKAAERGETAPKEEPREPRQAPEPRTDKPLMRKGKAAGWVVAPQIGDQHQAEIPDAPTRRARGPRRGRDAKASNVADGRLAWQAGNWKPHPDGNKGGPCGDLILAARHALDEGHPEGWPPRRRDDVHEAIEQREPFSWLGVDGQPVPLESDEQVLALIQAHGGNARRAAYAMTSGLGAAAEAGARKRFDQQRKLVLRAAAQGATPSCVGSRPLAAQLFDPARPPTRETRLFAALPGFMAGVSTKPRSKRSRRYMVPPDLTKRKSGVAAGQARVEEFKRKEREAKLKADEEARKAAEAQQRAENGDNGEEDKKESSSEDEEAQGRRRLERRGRGLGRADAAQRWRDLEQKADALCQRAQRHQPKAEKEPVKEAPSKKRRKKAAESSDDDDDQIPVAKNDQRPTLAECVAILREAEDLPDCPPSIGGTGEDPVALLKEKLDEIWRHVARCRLLSARARDCVARGSADEASAAYDARGFGYSVYARTNADGTPKQTANEIVAAGVGVSRSGARGLSTNSAVEEEEEEDVIAGLGAMSEREPTLPLEDAESCLRQLKQHCIRDDDALRPLAAALRAASAWRRKAHDSLEGQGAPARQIAPGQLLGLAQRGRAMPFVEDDLCEQLEERAADARNLDRELSRALDGVTTPNLQTLKELRERCRDFVGVKLEARRELDSLCDAAEQWAKDARRILTDPHAKKAPTKARRLLEQLTEIKCGVGPMGVTLQEQVAKADTWTEQALSVYEGGGDDYAALGKLVDAAEDVPAPRRALTACSRRHRFLQWVREARGALVACSVRAPGDHDEVIRPGIVAASPFPTCLGPLTRRVDGV